MATPDCGLLAGCRRPPGAIPNAASCGILDEVEVRFDAVSASIGDILILTVAGVAAESVPVSVLIHRTSSVETAWMAEVGVTPASDLEYEGRLQIGIDEECVAFATQVRLRDGDTIDVEGDQVALNPKELVATATDAAALQALLEQRQAARYEISLGRPDASGVTEHRVLCVIERLLMTQPLRLPGVRVLPVSARPSGSDQYALLDGLIRALDWSQPTQAAIPFDQWRQMIEPNRPWTAVVCTSVFAQDFNDAADIAWRQRDRLIAALGLARSARGRPVATFVQQRQADDSLKYRLFVEDETYLGNLLGGFRSGEDQRALLVNMAGIAHDPLLALLVDLFSEALAERSNDARYLRLWSILETLSGARIPAGAAVSLLDGNPFPGRPDHATTSSAAPRVYRFLADYTTTRKLDESFLAGPAASLYEAVRAWYARRNATGHYGRLDPADPRQARQSWMRWAQLTVPTGSSDPWLESLQRAVERVLRAELAQVGRPVAEL